MKTEQKPDPLAIRQPCRKYGIEEEIHPGRIAAFRRMTPGQKLVQVVQMYQAGISLSMAGMRMRHPDWNEDQVRREAQRLSTYGIA